MAGNLSGYAKIDFAVTNASSGFTTPYYDMSGYDKAIFIVECGTMASSGMLSLSGLQAVSSTGSGAVVTGHYTTMGSTSSLACDVVKADAVFLEGASTNMTDLMTLEINDITFTAQKSTAGDTGTFDSDRYVCSSSDGGVSTQFYDHLAAYINHATYGCTGLIATAASTRLTIDVYPPGEKVITTQLSISSGCQFYVARSHSIVEMNAAELAAASSMRYVGCTGTLAAGPTLKTNVTIIRSGARYSPDTSDLCAAYVGDI